MERKRMVMEHTDRAHRARIHFLFQLAGLISFAAAAFALSACQQPTASDLDAVTGSTAASSTTTIVPATTKAGAPDILSIVSGNAQTAVNGTQLSNQLTARVTDASGNAVPDVLVTFAVASGGGIIQTSTTVFSDASGLASATVLLGSLVGTQTFTASMSSGTVPAVTFTEISTAVASLVKIYPLVGTSSVGTTSLLVGDTFTMRAVLVSSTGAFIKEIPATWSMTGSLTTANLSITGGNPSKYATLSPTATGTGTIFAQVFDLTLIADNNITSTTTVTGTVTVSLALTPDSISIVSGNSQTGQVGTNLAQNLVVKVVNPGATAVPGVNVTFGVASGGGQIVSAQPVATDANGLATCIVRLGGLVGTGHSFTATMASGTATQVLFTGTATHGPAAALNFYAQPGGANAGTAFSTQPVVEVRDSYGNRVTSDSSSTVTLSLNTGTGVLGGSLTATAASGLATFTNVSYSVGETGVKLNAASSIAGVPSVVSGAFDVGTIIAAAQCAGTVGWQTIDGGCKDLTSGLVWSALNTAVGGAAMNWSAAVWDSATSGSPSPEPWQVARGITKDVSGTATVDANAAAYCQNLVESGLSDWRVPTVGDFIAADQHGAYNALKNSAPGPLWTSSATNATQAYYYGNFTSAASGTNYSYNNITTSYVVRCVRNPPPTKLIEVTSVAGGTNGLGVNVAFNTQPAVRLADTTNSTVTYSNAPVTLTVTSGPAGGQLCIHNKTTARLYNCSTSKSVNAVSGVASFNNLGGTNTGLAVNVAGTYTLTASSTALESVAMTNFPVNQIYPKALCASLGGVWVNGNGGCKDTSTGLIFSSVSPTTMNWYDAVWDQNSYPCTGTDDTNT
ncbi:MAG: DUF1566 domain-containing protein, partial [Deltaproteobacteria bacterium]|nr:DUF1566 domain-containing protein [Deltaproteobacteria bacterium]